MATEQQASTTITAAQLLFNYLGESREPVTIQDLMKRLAAISQSLADRGLAVDATFAPPYCGVVWSEQIEAKLSYYRGAGFIQQHPASRALALSESGARLLEDRQLAAILRGRDDTAMEELRSAIRKETGGLCG